MSKQKIVLLNVFSFFFIITDIFHFGMCKTSMSTQLSKKKKTVKKSLKSPSVER